MDGQRSGSENDLSFDRGGSGRGLLVCLHGLGAVAGVWRPFLDLAATHWRGRWLAPDLPGHGGSATANSYAIGDYAERLAPLVRAEASGEPVTLLGHSLGGAIALELAQPTYGIDAAAVHAIGIKAVWSDEELARMAELSRRPPRYFEARSEALAFYARQAGLAAAPDGSPLAARAVREDIGGWRSAVDMRAFAVERPPLRDLTAAAPCPVHLARGADDQMVSLEDLAAYDDDAANIPDAGHNAMVDAPGSVWTWFGRQQ